MRVSLHIVNQAFKIRHKTVGLRDSEDKKESQVYKTRPKWLRFICMAKYFLCSI
jgi:hypothetical protein